MQRIIQRTARAKRVVERQNQRKEKQMLVEERWERRQQLKRLQKKNSAMIRTARQNRVADWEAGQLRPRRDVGDQAGIYGSMSIQEAQGRPKLQDHDRPDWFPIAEGDRAVVITGRERGRINVVTNVNFESATVRLRDTNVSNLFVPEWMEREKGDDTTVVPQPLAIPLENVRLVHPLPDKRGVPRDVVIERLQPLNRVWDRQKKEWSRGDRLIPGTKTLIPWPEHLEQDPEIHKGDTRKPNISTFLPFLRAAPMPSGVIDELRNKYSRFRDRHDWEYVQAKTAEDEREARRADLGKTMRLPVRELQDARAKRKADAEAAGERELTDAQFDAIGKVIQEEKSKAKESAMASA